MCLVEIGVGVKDSILTTEDRYKNCNEAKKCRQAVVCGPSQICFDLGG